MQRRGGQSAEVEMPHPNDDASGGGSPRGAAPYHREPLRVPLVKGSSGAAGYANSSGSSGPHIKSEHPRTMSASSSSTASTEYFGESAVRSLRSVLPAWLGGAPPRPRGGDPDAITGAGGGDDSSSAQFSTSTISPTAKRVARDDLVTGNADEWAELNEKWTFIDQRRLNSVDGLFHRSLEYHNLNHSFRVVDPAVLDEMAARAGGERGKAEAAALGVNAASFTFLHAPPHGPSASLASLLDGSALPTQFILSLDRMQSFLREELAAYGAGSRGVAWLHVRDLRALYSIAAYLNMDYICQAGFFDLRAHSNVHCTHNAVFMTLCTMHLSGVDAHLYKVYAFASKGFLVTFERDLLPDISINQPILSDLLYKGLQSRIAGIGPRCARLGAMHGLYEIAMETLGLSDKMLEFTSRSISFAKRQMSRAHSLPMITIINAHRMVQILRSCTLMLDRQVMESANFLCRFKDTLDSLHVQLNRSIATKENYPYIIDMADSYRFRSQCLQSMYKDELIAVLDTLKSLQNLSSMKKNIDMTLVATVFLPLTFIASLYGMNFEKDGGYSIGLLNDAHGPEVFWAMCVFVFFLNVIFFLRSGYISWNSTYKWLVEDEEAERKEAIMEELRRAKESSLRRSIASYGARLIPTINMTGGEGFGIMNRLRSASNSSAKNLNIAASTAPGDLVET